MREAPTLAVMALPIAALDLLRVARNDGIQRCSRASRLDVSQRLPPIFSTSE